MLNPTTKTRYHFNHCFHKPGFSFYLPRCHTAYLQSRALRYANIHPAFPIYNRISAYLSSQFLSRKIKSLMNRDNNILCSTQDATYIFLSEFELSQRKYLPKILYPIDILDQVILFGEASVLRILLFCHIHSIDALVSRVASIKL